MPVSGSTAIPSALSPTSNVSRSSRTLPSPGVPSQYPVAEKLVGLLVLGTGDHQELVAAREPHEGGKVKGRSLDRARVEAKGFDERGGPRVESLERYAVDARRLTRLA